MIHNTDPFNTVEYSLVELKKYEVAIEVNSLFNMTHPVNCI